MSLAQKINRAYSDLGLGPGASLADVKSAYRRLAKSLHPDLQPGTQNLLMSKVNRAYKILRDFLGPQEKAGGFSLDQAYRMVHEHFKKAAAHAWKPSPGPVPLLGDPPSGWRLSGLRREQGRVIYQVEVSGRPGGLVLPVRCQKTCRQCEGGGIYEGSRQRSLCPACRGKGRITRADRVTVTLPHDWASGDTLKVPVCRPAGGSIWVEIMAARAGEEA